MAIMSLDKIRNSVVRRISTGFSDLDRILGRSLIDGSYVYGFPVGRLSYLSGSPGVGKTRLGIAIVKRMNAQGSRIMTFQGEVRPEEFRQWTGTDVRYPEEFFIGDDRELDAMLSAIRKYKPHFVIIDSANMIEGFNAPSETREIFDSFKDQIGKMDCHCMMIGHLTKEGLTKGSADVEHLVDTVCKAQHPPKPGRPKKIIVNGREALATYKTIPGSFIFTVTKNRYGAVDGWVAFRHREWGIEYIGSSINGIIPQPEMRSIEEVMQSDAPKRIKPSIFERFLNWMTS